MISLTASVPQRRLPAISVVIHFFEALISRLSDEKALISDTIGSDLTTPTSG
jgi:hypothetical protein